MWADTLRLPLPEVVLVVAVVLIHGAATFAYLRRARRAAAAGASLGTAVRPTGREEGGGRSDFGRSAAWSWIAAGGIALAALALWMPSDVLDRGGTAAADPLVHYARSLALVLGALGVLLSFRRRAAPPTSPEVGWLLLAVVGLMLTAGARDLILLLVGLQLVTVASSILLYLGRRDAASEATAAKYFLLSLLASALLAYGLSFLYGLTGSVELGTISARLAATPPGGGLLARIALVLIFSGLALPIAAVPFHFHLADICGKTTNVNAALLSVVPPAAGLVGLVRLVVTMMPPAQAHPWQPYAWRIALTLAVLSMACGNLMALRQDNLRRLLAYCSICHVGYMLIGLAVALATPTVGSAQWDGTAALLVCLCVYALATIGALATLAHLEGQKKEIVRVDELAGLGRTRPLAAAAMSVFMFSLAGIPPLAGFWGKLALFAGGLSIATNPAAGGGLRPWFLAAVLIAALNFALTAIFCVRIVVVMCLRLPLAAPKAQGGAGAWIAALVCAVLTVGVGLWPGPLLRESSRASPTAAVPAGHTPTIGPDPRRRGAPAATMRSMRMSAADPSPPLTWRGG